MPPDRAVNCSVCVHTPACPEIRHHRVDRSSASGVVVVCNVRAHETPHKCFLEPRIHSLDPIVIISVLGPCGDRIQDQLIQIGNPIGVASQEPWRDRINWRKRTRTIRIDFATFVARLDGGIGFLTPKLRIPTDRGVDTLIFIESGLLAILCLIPESRHLYRQLVFDQNVVVIDRVAQ
ncbi:MAG: hypothetical protein BWY82_00530 [Verrucomicrobia bacterium ADurb.Bin474]|nr:MAG: hypothetical protein BWY82_00530 [Verrucomicrobia bacterium ADurb.Bin474]